MEEYCKYVYGVSPDELTYDAYKLVYQEFIRNKVSTMEKYYSGLNKRLRHYRYLVRPYAENSDFYEMLKFIKLGETKFYRGNFLIDVHINWNDDFNDGDEYDNTFVHELAVAPLNNSLNITIDNLNDLSLRMHHKNMMRNDKPLDGCFVYDITHREIYNIKLFIERLRYIDRSLQNLIAKYIRQVDSTSPVYTLFQDCNVTYSENWRYKGIINKDSNGKEYISIYYAKFPKIKNKMQMPHIHSPRHRSSDLTLKSNKRQSIISNNSRSSNRHSIINMSNMSYGNMMNTNNNSNKQTVCPVYLESNSFDEMEQLLSQTPKNFFINGDIYPAIVIKKILVKEQQDANGRPYVEFSCIPCFIDINFINLPEIFNFGI